MSSPPSQPLAERTRRVKHPVDEVLPPQKLAVYGIQHVLAFYAGAVIVPILLAGAIGLTESQLVHLINADLFTCGIASIIQSVGFWKVGVRLPLLQGVTFTAVAPMIAIGTAAGGGTEGLVDDLWLRHRGRSGDLLRGSLLRQADPFLPSRRHRQRHHDHRHLAAAGRDQRRGGLRRPRPRTADSTTPWDAGDHRGHPAGVQGLHRDDRRAGGLVIGTGIAWILGDADFGAVADAHWVGVTTPFYFGVPKFVLTAIISMIVVMMITAVETTGDVFATGEIVEKRVGRRMFRAPFAPTVSPPHSAASSTRSPTPASRRTSGWCD